MLSKPHADASVQTSPWNPATGTIQPPSGVKNLDQHAAEAQSMLKVLNIMHQNDALTGYSRTEITRAPRKTYLSTELVACRPPRGERPNRRIVSLPETIIEETESRIEGNLEMNTRSVSMPASFRHFAAFSSYDDSTSFSSDDPPVSPQTLDAVEIRTPSSSPSSIDFLRYGGHTPKPLLRHQIRTPQTDGGM